MLAYISKTASPGTFLHLDAWPIHKNDATSSIRRVSKRLPRFRISFEGNALTTIRDQYTALSIPNKADELISVLLTDAKYALDFIHLLFRVIDFSQGNIAASTLPKPHGKSPHPPLYTITTNSDCTHSDPLLAFGNIRQASEHISMAWTLNQNRRVANSTLSSSSSPRGSCRHRFNSGGTLTLMTPRLRTSTRTARSGRYCILRWTVSILQCSTRSCGRFAERCLRSIGYLDCLCLGRGEDPYSDILHRGLGKWLKFFYPEQPDVGDATVQGLIKS